MVYSTINAQTARDIRYIKRNASTVMSKLFLEQKCITRAYAVESSAETIITILLLLYHYYGNTTTGEVLGQKHFYSKIDIE